jgi:flagellar motor protein MotB
MTDLPEMAPPADEGDDWLVSFADLVSILLGFFVIMYAKSR